MAHNIQTRDIQTGVKMAWHKKTNVVESITAENCGIVYGMSIEPLYIKRGETLIEVDGRQVVSTDDGLPVGRAVGQDYKLIANSEIWNAVASGLEGSTHEIVSCGTVSDRSLGFISVKVSDNFIAANRDTANVMNVIWGHGGNKAVVARSGFTVVVCQNTLNMAMAERADFKLSIRHTSKANVFDLSKAIDTHIGVAAEFKMAMDELHAVSATASVARKIYAGFLSDETPETKTGVTRLSNTVDSMESLFCTGKGNAGRTMADVLNGATDYYSHGNGENPWKQFVSSEFGAAGTNKSRLLDVLRNPAELSATILRGENVLAELGI